MLIHDQIAKHAASSLYEACTVSTMWFLVRAVEALSQIGRPFLLCEYS